MKSNLDRGIFLAQKELMKIGSHLGGIGLRLDGTPYNGLYNKMRDSIVELNNVLIKHIRKNELFPNGR